VRSPDPLSWIISPLTIVTVAAIELLLAGGSFIGINPFVGYLIVLLIAFIGL
jgi:hypothetical protein